MALFPCRKMLTSDHDCSPHGRQPKKFNRVSESLSGQLLIGRESEPHGKVGFLIAHAAPKTHSKANILHCIR